MSLAEWLDDVVTDDEDQAGWDWPRTADRRRKAAGGRDDFSRRLDEITDRIDELGERESADEIGEVAEAVALLAHRVQESRARSGDILEQIMDRLDRVESAGPPRSRRDRAGKNDDVHALSRLTEALAEQIDRSDAINRATIDALRDRAGRMQQDGRDDDRLDEVLGAIHDLDSRLGEIERLASRARRDGGRQQQGGLRRQIDRLRRRVGAEEGDQTASVADSLGALAARIGALTASQTPAAAPEHVAANPAPAGAYAVQDERFRRIEARLAELTGRTAAIEYGSQRPTPVAAATPQEGPPAGGANGDLVNEIAARQRALDGETSARVEEAAEPAVDRQLMALSRRIEELREDDRSAREIDALRGEIVELRGAIAGTDETRRHIETLAEKIDTLFERERSDDGSARLMAEIAKLRATVDRNSASAGAIEQLSARIDELAQRPTQSSEIEMLTAEVAGLRSQVENDHGIDRAVATLAAKLDEIGAASGGRDIAELRDDVSALRHSIEGDGMTQAFDTLGAEISRLSSKLDMAARIGADSAVLDEFREQLAMLRGAIDMTPIVRELDRLQAGYDSIVQRLDSVQTEVGPTAALDEIHRDLAGLRQAIERLDVRDLLDVLDARVAHLAEKVDRLESRDALADSGMSAEIAGRLDQLQRAITDPASLEAVQALEGRVVEIADKLDRIDPGQAALPSLDSLTDQVARLNEALERKPEAGQLPVDRIEAQVAGLLDRLDSAAGAPAPDFAELTEEIAGLRQVMTAMPARDTEALEEQIRDLAERLETGRPSGAESGVLAQLEAQIGRMAERLESADRRFADMARIEENLAQIQALVASSQDGAFDAAREAARQAVQDFGERPANSPAGAESMVQALRDEMRSLQDAASISDRRTIETLQAVQDTLKTIAGRLSALESEVETVAEPAAGSAVPAADPPPPAELPQDVADESDGRRRSDRQAPMPPRGPDDASMAPPGRDEVPAADWSEDTRPLEPGSGKPRMQAGAAAGGAAEADDPKASFIAAARRAAQVAASEMTEEGDQPKVGRWAAIRNRLSPKSSKRESKAAAKPAARPKRGDKAVKAPRADERPVQTPANDGGGRFGLAQVTGDRRRMLMIALAIVVLAFGALQLFGPAEDEGIVEVAETSAPTETLGNGDQAPAAVPEDAAEDAAAEAAAEPADESVDAATGVIDDTPEGTPTSEGPAAPQAGGQDMPTSLVADDDGSAAPMRMATPAADTAGSVETAAAETFDTPGGELKTAPMPPDEIGSLRLRTAAARGNPSAQFEVGARYTEGRGVAQDLKTAAEWYERAAAQGLAVAQYRLGSLYEKGQGVGKDLAIAQSWYAKAAEQGNVKAMHNIAVIYAEGADGTPDLDSALKWFLAAGDYGLKDSQYNLGILYAKGIGVDRDFRESYKWFALAAAQGDEDAAKKRDAIANALDEGLLAEARLLFQTWQRQNPNPKANKADMPAEGWGDAPDHTASVETPGMIRQAQELLNRLGFDAGTADGVAGPRTREAVRAFQRSNSLPETGKIGPVLLRALQSERV